VLRRLDLALARAGYPRPPWRTPREHARALAARGAPGADLVSRVVTRYNEVRFGGQQLAPGEEADLVAVIRGLEHQLRRPGPIARDGEPGAT
jgi:hypothetical protein